MVSSSNVTQRGIVFATLTAIGLIMTKWAIGPILLCLLLFPEIRREIAETFYSGLKEHRALFIRILIFAIPVLFYVLASPAPPDDLLREMTAFLHHYDYRNLYWGSPRLRNGDTSYVWSWGLQWLYRYLPLKYAYLPVQYALVVGWSIIPVLAFRKAIRLAAPKAETLAVWTVIALAVAALWAMPGFTSRIVQARPENLGALLGISAFLVDSVWGLVVFTLAMGCFIPMYWLSLIYIPMVALAQVPWKQRAYSGGVLLVIFSAYWLSGFQIDWFAWFFGLHTAIGHRVVSIAEDAPLWTFGKSVMMLVGIVTLVYAYRIKDVPDKTLLPFVLLLLWFVLPDMTRYIDVLAPLMLLLVVRMLPAFIYERINLPVVLFSVICLFFLVPSNIPSTALPKLVVHDAKPGQRVLSTLGPQEYFALYENPELRFAPACELGYTRRKIQLLGLYLAGKTPPKGMVLCQRLRHYRISWVIEKDVVFNAQTGLSRCLRLQSQDSRGYGIWKVRYGHF
ncbi:hypothetical protein ACJU26_09210 [Acidithiobacillus sp. M4-SHS-6]|uniref:hypothetical protein n=1 Tax=Acidithiobacillus sp. M4-SHS-6 TaxID=3383024 RepID=UPI0039BE4FBD